MPDLWNERVNALDARLEGALAKIVKAAEVSCPETPEKPLHVFLVGGAVRDMILGRDTRDIDVVVEGDIMAIADRLPEYEWQFYERFMTASARLEIGELDLVTARREWYEAPGQLPAVEPGTLADDLRRRDFTVNAMALELSFEASSEFASTSASQLNAVLHDPLGGQADLNERCLRVLHDKSFYDDPTRLYRAVRYMARLGLSPDDKTLEQMRRSVEDGVLATLSNDRIMRELFLNFSEPILTSMIFWSHEYNLIELGETKFDDVELKEAVEYAMVLSEAQGLCSDDRAAGLFGYYCLKSKRFAERFKQSSITRKIKAAAKLVASTSSKDLAEQLGVQAAFAVGIIRGHDKEKPAIEISGDSEGTQEKSEPGQNSGPGPDPLPEDAISGPDPLFTSQAQEATSPEPATEDPGQAPDSDVYSVKLEAFEGPMDLLLHLIHESEVDIYDIPISHLCTQYLEYLIHLEGARVEIAGEFLVMAATLLEIKSMMLLPDREAGIFESWDETDDPRTELVQKLVEYKRFKDAAKLLGGLEMVEGARYTREASDLSVVLPISPEKLNEPTEVDLLGEALRRVLSKLDRHDTHRDAFFSTLSREPYAVEDAMQALAHKLKNLASVSFEDLFDAGVSRNVVVTTFLALLEMLKLKRIRVVQDSMFTGILITRRDETDAEDLKSEQNDREKINQMHFEEDSDHGTTLL